MTMHTYLLILDIFLAILALYLAFNLRVTFYKTNSKVFLTFSWALIVFGVIDIIAALLHYFVEFPIDDFGYHQWASIILLMLLVFIFQPTWKKPIGPKKD